MAGETNKGISRRDLLRATAISGVGGLVLGGIGGYLAGQSEAPALTAAPPPASTPAVATTGAPAVIARKKVRIGSTMPLTGWAAADGAEMKNGLTLAVEELNAGGGIGGMEIETVILDAADMAPDKAVSDFRRLIEKEKVHALILGYHTGAGGEFDLVADAGIPYLHAHTYEGFAQLVRSKRDKYWMIFNVGPSEKWYSPGIAFYLDNLIKSRAWTPSSNTVAIITSDNPYAIGIAKTYEEEAAKRGWKVSLYEQVVSPVAEWGPTMSKIRKDPPGLIYITDFNPVDLATFAKAFAPNPTPSLLYQQFGPSVPEYLEMAGTAANGVLWSTLGGVIPDRIGMAFRERYKKRFNVEAGWSYAGGVYDMVMAYAAATALVGDPGETKKICARLTSGLHRGTSGTMAFDPEDLHNRPYPTAIKDPSLGMPHLIFQIQGRKQVLVSPDPYTQGTFQLPSWLKS